MDYIGSFQLGNDIAVTVDEQLLLVQCYLLSSELWQQHTVSNFKREGLQVALIVILARSDFEHNSVSHAFVFADDDA